MADQRLQRACESWLRAHAEAPRANVVAVDEHVDDAVRTEIASLCARGLELADRAAGLAQRDAAARLQQALHLSLLAWANGPARSLFAGYGSKLTAAIDAAVALDPPCEAASPLRLSGRFRGKAPWPYGDLASAEKSLARAVELAPCVVNHAFYGDELYRLQRAAEAEAQWRAAAAASDDESRKWSGHDWREQARARFTSWP